MGNVLTISDDEASLIVKAMEHNHAYSVTTKRENGQYTILAERLQGKPPAQET
jgi:hypothetical protein